MEQFSSLQDLNQKRPLQIQTSEKIIEHSKNLENDLKFKACDKKNQTMFLKLSQPKNENSFKTLSRVKPKEQRSGSRKEEKMAKLENCNLKPKPNPEKEQENQNQKQDCHVPLIPSWNLILALNLLFSLLTILLSFVILPKLLNVIVVSAVPLPTETVIGNTSVNPLPYSTFPVHQLELEIDDGQNRHSETESDSNGVGVGCVCDGDCERIGPSDCPWGLTLDVCGCCFICSRGEGEPCGGATGNCKKGLHCQQRGKGDKAGQGICSKDGDETICVDPVERYGCLFDGESCVCENHWICPQVDLFLFDSEDSCRSRIAILNSHPNPAEQTHSEFQFQFQFQPPTSSSSSAAALSFSSSSNVATESCDGVSCAEIEDCPLDSYRLPTPKNLQSGEIILDKSKDCCQFAQPCMCNPNVICTPPKCPRKWLPSLVLNATGQPGNCCPLWACVLDQ